MSELTWENIVYNLEDALEELQKLDKQIASGNMQDEVEFQIAMQHIYHHLNFAWNTRHESIQNYADMMKEKLNQWGEFPNAFELL
jgi:hypothetical protein